MSERDEEASDDAAQDHLEKSASDASNDEPGPSDTQPLPARSPHEPDEVSADQLRASAELLRGSPNRARTGRRARALAQATIRWSEDVHRPFLHALNAYQESLTALREVHDVVTPSLDKLDETKFREELEPLFREMSPEQIEALSQFVSNASAGLIAGGLSLVTEDKKRRV